MSTLDVMVSNISVLSSVQELLSTPPRDMPSLDFVPPPQCMPDEYKHEDTITAYWNYYIGEKHSVANKNEPIYLKPFTR